MTAAHPAAGGVLEVPPFWLDAGLDDGSPLTPVSAWRTHAPFASWLMGVLRPDVVVELGTHFGFSCFVFAEAAQRLGLPTVVHALDTWQGDEHAGRYGDDVHDYVAGVVASRYPEHVRMVRSTFEDARSGFADGSVDLLHIDGRHRYEDVAEDYGTWRSAVRDGGIILFHDIAERRDDFGVWRLWDEIASEGRSFAFDHGHGLGVLAVGEVRSPELAALFEADPETAARIREDLFRLGATRELELLQGAILRLRDDLGQEWRRREELESVIRSQQQRIDALTASTSWRVTAPLRALGRLRGRRG